MKARGRLVRQIAGREHIDASGRRVRISRDTLDRWIRAWRRGGFDALVPSPRQSSPRLPAEIIELALGLKRENPERTAAQVRRILRTQLGWAPGERTLQRYFADQGLIISSSAAAAVFGRFEANRPNELWTGDALCRYRHKASYADRLVMGERSRNRCGRTGFVRCGRHNHRLSRNAMIVSVGW
jgi:putative transposase